MQLSRPFHSTTPSLPRSLTAASRVGAGIALASLLGSGLGCEFKVGDPTGLDGSSFAASSGGSSSATTGSSTATDASSESGMLPDDPPLPEPGGSSTGDPVLPPEDSTGGTESSTGGGSGSTTASSREPTGTSAPLCSRQPTDIPDAGGPVRIALDQVDGGAVAAVAVRLDIQHGFIEDLTVDLEHAGQTIRLFERDCGFSEDLLLTYSDDGQAFSCAAAAGGGDFAPAASLSAFDGVDAAGDWVIVVEDSAAGFSGTAREVCVELSL